MEIYNLCVLRNLFQFDCGFRCKWQLAWRADDDREGDGETEGDADSDVHVEHAVVASLSGA